MNTNTVRLNITLQRDLIQALDTLAGPRKRSQFISKAIELSLRNVEKEKVEGLLEKGYRATKLEGIDLSKEFENIDVEGWDEY
jgi:metal-responsive CopG/Arc/MetJ family transcriptional regulator